MLDVDLQVRVTIIKGQNRLDYHRNLRHFAQIRLGWLEQRRQLRSSRGHLQGKLNDLPHVGRHSPMLGANHPRWAPHTKFLILFQAMSVLVRDVKYHTIDTDQLKIVLLYAEQDMHDHDRQATAFNLLKAVIARKLVVPEIHEVMAKVAELSITSELGHVRVQARTVFHQYMMDYPLGDKLEKHLSFYLSQMSYEMQFGRESAIEMISALISSFPKVGFCFL